MSDVNKDFFKKGKKIIEFSIEGDDRVYQIADRHSYTFGSLKLTVPTPSIAGIFLNAAEKETLHAKDIYKSCIAPILSRNGEIELNELESAHLFDYLEHIQIAIITLYTAIESFVNSQIPRDFLYFEEKNGGSLAMDKPYIERNKSTDFKLSTIIPEALEIESPKKSKHWPNFKKLENCRNDIIHLKTNALSEGDLDKNLMYSLLKPSIFKVIASTRQLIAEMIGSIDESYNSPILSKKDQIFKLRFQDWELMEEYLVAKHILPPSEEKTVEGEDNLPENQKQKDIRSFSLIKRIK